MGFLTPSASGELDVLRTFALQQLAQLRTTVHGLTDEQAHSVPSASTLNLTGLLRHGAQVAVYWSTAAASAPDCPQVPEWVGEELRLEDAVADQSSLEETLAYLDRCADHASSQLAAVRDLSAPVPVPEAPYFPADLTHWEARWCIAHIIAEIARHAGHADILRESIDGKGSYELNDLADSAS